jgi:hypothetical protein
VNWSGQESSPNSNTINTFTNTAPVQAINFDGLVTFTDIGGDKVVTTNDITSIQGGLLKTAVIQSNNYSAPTPLTEPFTVGGMEIDFNLGKITSRSFYIDSSGNANFKGSIQANAGTIGD